MTFGLLGLLLAMAVVQTFLVAVMVLRSTGQVFCRVPRCWDLPDVVLAIRLGLRVLEGRPQR